MDFASALNLWLWNLLFSWYNCTRLGPGSW